MPEGRHAHDRQWLVQPNSEAFLVNFLSQALQESPAAAGLAGQLLEGAGVRLRDIVDFVQFCSPALTDDLAAAGWSLSPSGHWENRQGLFPPFVPGARTTIWLRVESLSQFLAARGLQVEIEGDAHGTLRRARVFSEGPISFGVVERNGHAGFDVPVLSDAQIRFARMHSQSFRARRRQFDAVEDGLRHTETLVDEAVQDLGPHWACSLWLSAEREYWLSRCSTGRLQKARQDALGIGWANIDHHTYDASRQHFRHTIRILEKLGYQLREMLYAGELAGWGSQVLEQPVIGSTIFADVDLAPEELTIDFAHDVLPPLIRHRRAGLLSALLGESILEAGLNHVAGLFDQRKLREQLQARQVRLMSPFSDMPHLYQELTDGDWVAVDPRRVDALEAAGHLSAANAEQLRQQGSIGTHLENIERNDGFKGFNREGIDSVLRKLDPRAYLTTSSMSA
ncbi:hypothetical protein [Roseateles toxinivorans]|uniref:Uncharacterized protein n=1 Tax=Roseateles toxinivorans TaxID=270368 RepID=A0A4R6QGR8_9BURK|nr:hypothetical protein [Roseateles toxinivorans]TDP61256.1 hypothetical protein DES47_11428 [Roseateles toxinivorans]